MTDPPTFVGHHLATKVLIGKLPTITCNLDVPYPSLLPLIVSTAIPFSAINNYCAIWHTVNVTNKYKVGGGTW